MSHSLVYPGLILCVIYFPGPHVGSQRPSRTLLQALRATLLLVPLLGLHYLVTPFRPEKGHAWEFFYEVLSAITASLQVWYHLNIQCEVFFTSFILYDFPLIFKFWLTSFIAINNKCTRFQIDFFLLFTKLKRGHIFSIWITRARSTERQFNKFSLSHWIRLVVLKN